MIRLARRVEQSPPPYWQAPSDLPSDEYAARRVYGDRGRTLLCFVTCPAGHTCALTSPPHTIASDGTAQPSLVCPVAGCGFHEFVTFDGWRS